MKILLSHPMTGYNSEEVYERREELKKIMLEIKCGILDKILFYSNVIEHMDSLEFLDNYIDLPEMNNVYLLGEAIQVLSRADLVLFDYNYKNSKGCQVEKLICDLYQIPYIILK